MKMDDNKLKILLKQADSGDHLTPLDTANLASSVRRRLHRRKTVIRSGMFSTAAMIMVTFILGQRQYELYQKQQQIVRLEQRIEDLNRRTEETLVLAQNLLARQQQEVQRQYASYQNPIRQQVEEAAFILVYQADRMKNKYNNAEAAIDYYNQVIERFGDTPSAQTARERLTEIEKQNQPNQI
jgi:TolA-binding protein